ncbi:MAG TPA: hypothetical protein VF092_25850 [Longimicrobium sp.]
MHYRQLIARAGCGAALVLLAACSDQTTLPPAVAPAGTMAQMRCTVDVPSATLACAAVKPAGPAGVNADRIIGNQDVYVKLSSSGTSWDSDTEILQSNVTVQNLGQQSMGTANGSAVTGVKVFFNSGPTVTAGSGSVTLANADGMDTFLSSNQSYFLYNEILAPYQISTARNWQFNVPSTVTSFSFTVYVWTQMVNEALPIVDKVWTGAVSTAWETAGNWQGGVVPDSTSVVAIPPDSLLSGAHNQPVLTADADVAHLRVGYGSSLGLAGHQMRVRGNVDAVGTISGGNVWNSGTGTLLRGNVGALQVSGGAKMQGAVKASAAVSVSGSLNTAGQTLTISIP